MKIHPLLNDPLAVLVYKRQVPAWPSEADFQQAACEVLKIMQVELDSEKVAIKPNATSAERFADPDLGVGTHPTFIGGMVEYFNTHGARSNGIYVVEDPRDTDDFNPRHWEGTGYLEMATQTGARLRCPNSHYCTYRHVPRPLVHPVRNVSRYAVDLETVLINVPKMKTHNLAITSLCLKNLMGLDDVFDRHYCGQALQELPGHQDGLARSEWMHAAQHEAWQYGLARRLADLAQVITPSLNVIEGIVGRDGTGFRNGQNYPLGLVIAGINMVAVDSLTSAIMGFDPQELIYLKVAASIGLGCNDLRQLKVYIASGGILEICPDLGALRVHLPFQVIRGILNEDLELAPAVG